MLNLYNLTQIRLVVFSSYMKKIWYSNHNVCKSSQQEEETKKQMKEINGSIVKNIQNIVKENVAFENYYKAQKICPEQEWSTFMQTLREHLPIVFRVISSKSEAAVLNNLIQSEYFTQILSTNLQDEEEKAEINPIILPWYPGGNAWQIHLSRTDFRHNKALLYLQEFLAEEAAAGAISRQEAVSMIPPIVLDVKPHHSVLDMCAAPGSKTTQLIEFLHACQKDRMPSGFILANEMDRNRCHTFINRIKRLESPCIVFTNHNAATMPSMIITDDKNPNSSKSLKFHRILCDVPCSGDAILRKKPALWLKWNPLTAYCLHGRQYRILKRGCELLSEGGRLVYSTCSFNPIENEAVIHRILQETGDSLKLVEVSDMLPGLKFNKGLSYWRIVSKDMGFYENYEDVPTNWQNVIRPCMFPPKQESVLKYQLDKCIRILPHHQDTGGFFVAVLEKTSPVPWENEQKSVMKEKRKRSEKMRMNDSKDQFVFFSTKNEDVLPSIKKYYELENEFDPTCLLTRCHVGKKNNIYMVSPRVKDVVQKNEANIKIINTGVKTFVRFCGTNKMECAFKLSQEGLRTLAPYIGASRRVRLFKDDLIYLLQKKDPSNPPKLTMFSEYTQNQVKDLTISSCVLEYKDTVSNLELELVGFRGLNFLQTNIENSQAVHYLRLLGADYSMYELSNMKKYDMHLNNEKDDSDNGHTSANKE